MLVDLDGANLFWVWFWLACINFGAPLSINIVFVRLYWNFLG